MANEELTTALKGLGSSAVRPKLQIPFFYGTIDKDKLSYKNFLSQFNNAVDASGTLGKPAKLSYLKNSLKDYALSLIAHLTITEDNYDRALKILEDEFLDEELIVHEYFGKILNKACKYDPKFESLKSLINDLRACIFELQSYDLDFLEEDSPGLKLLSHIIFEKLPAVFKRALVNKVESNYPTLNDLFEHHNELIKTLISTSYKKESSESKTPSKPQSQNDKRSAPACNYSNQTVDKSTPSLSNFATSDTTVLQCKFCDSNEHKMFKCNKYSDYEPRKKRCVELELCTLCTNKNHTSKGCNYSKKAKTACFICKSTFHVPTMCPQRVVPGPKQVHKSYACSN